MGGKELRTARNVAEFWNSRLEGVTSDAETARLMFERCRATARQAYRRGDQNVHRDLAAALEAWRVRTAPPRPSAAASKAPSFWSARLAAAADDAARTRLVFDRCRATARQAAERGNERAHYSLAEVLYAWQADRST